MSWLVGVDEVGRGPLAGPVVACSVLLQLKNQNKFKKFSHKLGVNDSKKLSSAKRIGILDKLKINIDTLKTKKIYHRDNFSFCLCKLSEKKIDSLNIFQASLKCMKESSLALLKDQGIVKDKLPGVVLIDGKFSFHLNSKYQFIDLVPVIKGDIKEPSIALASVIAKEYRDHLMKKYSIKYPHYGFEKNSGYPTKVHKEAIEKFGVLPIHRKTFAGVREFI